LRLLIFHINEAVSLSEVKNSGFIYVSFIDWRKLVLRGDLGLDEVAQLFRRDFGLLVHLGVLGEVVEVLDLAWVQCCQVLVGGTELDGLRPGNILIRLQL
jgi:hypothetical protein